MCDITASSHPPSSGRKNLKELVDEEKAIFETKGLQDSCSSSSDDDDELTTHYSDPHQQRRNNYSIALIICLILILGSVTSSAFLLIGIRGAREEGQDQFDRSASDMTHKISDQFHEYVSAASLVHNRCRARNFSRTDFRELYEYLVDSGLRFKAVQFDPNITREERPAAEAEARAYYAKNYNLTYRGFVGFETEIPKSLEPRSEQDFYFPIHYMEPIPGNEAAIDLDYYSHISRRRTLQSCFDTGAPALTDRLELVSKSTDVSRCGTEGLASYGVVLMHPGVNLTTQRDTWPRDLSSIVICIPSLLEQAAQEKSASSAVYIFDTNDSSGDMKFLGGIEVVQGREGEDSERTFLPETSISDLHGRWLYQEEVVAANKVWKVIVVALDETYHPNLAFVILGGLITFAASVCLALWVFNSTRRITKMNELKAEAEAEKAALILDNAREATQAERSLNDFIAHEVRNPVSAAMAACSFVKASVNQKQPLQDEESRQSVREDVAIIDSSLSFVNDLLRNMLELHKAKAGQLTVKVQATDLLHDVLEPVAGMLHHRATDAAVEVIVDCPPNLFVQTDSLRLKQIMLNLGRNSRKFCSKGFIRLRAYQVDGQVGLSVDDSGVGIPAGKRDKLFSKFQESLDVLSQGTGIGLFLCKNLIELLGGEIYLDDTYDSGVDGFPGTRFCIDLKVPPCDDPLHTVSHTNLLPDVRVGHASTPKLDGLEDDRNDGTEARTELPTELSVLFVDDDAILRKLFSRSIKKVAPGWRIREASNGETALKLTEEDDFDLIFMDQYMASIEKQMLGTETVREMRARGIASRLCGLSANDTEAEFLDSGADCFMIKPFPCEAESLSKELCRVLFQDSKHSRRVANKKA